MSRKAFAKLKELIYKALDKGESIELIVKSDSQMGITKK